jgi:hypothetical protein
VDFVSQISIVLILLMEVSCLTYLEYRAWRTIYTPLCVLMLPYVAVLLITIAIPADFGFVRFNYESIYVWILGLPLFAIPSFGFATLMRHYNLPVISTIEDEEKGFSKVLFVIGVILAGVLLLKLYKTLSHGFYLFGTEDFAEEFSGHGVWAHLRGMIIPILILALYYVKKKDFLLWGLIGLMLVIQFSYMVKGAIIITVVSALMMKLYTGKIRLNLTLVLGVIAGAVLVFYLIYMVIPLLGNDGEANMNLVEFIARHFVHYFTSGTLGWSYDLDQGIPDRNDFSYVVAPFVNIWNAINGYETISPVNPIYWNTGITYTNVRTFFGTLYIYTTPLSFATYTLVASSVIYFWKMLATITRNVYIYTILFYYCGLMAMGWFEFYMFHLSAIEVPIVALFYAWLAQKGKEVSLG